MKDWIDNAMHTDPYTIGFLMGLISGTIIGWLYITMRRAKKADINYEEKYAILLKELAFLSRDEDVATIARIYRNTPDTHIHRLENRLRTAIYEKDTFFCPVEVETLINKVFT